MLNRSVKKIALVVLAGLCLLLIPNGAGAQDGGTVVYSDLWVKSILRTAAGSYTLIWKEVGRDNTPSGDKVISGYFYADPNEFAYGSVYNPELFVKIYIASNGWTNIAFNHVTVDPVDVYSAHEYAGAPQQSGTVTLTSRLAEQSYTGVDTSAEFTVPGSGAASASAQDGGYVTFADLWAKSVLQTPNAAIGLIWKEVGRDTTPSGDIVVSGYFYADPDDFAYGSEYNPEVFVKIYIASNGWANMAFNHVTVDNVSVYSAYQYSGSAQQDGSVTLGARLDEQTYTGVTVSDETASSATGSARTDTSATVRAATGAAVFVPEGAVAPDQSGNVGTTVFSIERDNSLSPTLPEGEALASDIYRFGPSGFVFQQAVSVTVPLADPEGIENAVLYRINETSGESELLGGVYDPSAGTVTGQTTHFSPIFAASAPANNSAAGCILLDNSGAGQYTWRNVCAYRILEFYYPGAASFEGSASVSPDGCYSGWCNRINYIVPQGRYQLCVETYTKEFQSDLPRLTGHTIIDEVVDVNKPYSYPRYDISKTVYLGNLTMDQEGPCPCSSTPTSSVGTGELGITLVWHASAAVDLDLWVTEPNGNVIDYGSPTSSTGGTLDIDNKCSNYVAARPENIFWTSAPAGEYIVKVDWYDYCDTAISSASYEVRVVNKGETKTYTGTITTDQTLEVVRVNVQ